ncbi:MAG: hypothetical protein JRE28_15845 [Deltaproteobacteria bacterium]|nr:hypothetical protein [Deltaproteobacteria bacterium]
MVTKKMINNILKDMPGKYKILNEQLEKETDTKKKLNIITQLIELDKTCLELEVLRNECKI